MSTDGRGRCQYGNTEGRTNRSFSRLGSISSQRHVHEHLQLSQRLRIQYKMLEILVTTIHRQVETFRACDEWCLGLQVLTELLVVKLYRGLRQVGKLVTRWGECHICLPVIDADVGAGLLPTRSHV